MIIVDGEALGSILHSALTKTGKPKAAEIKKAEAAQEPSRETAGEPEPESSEPQQKPEPKPESAKAAPAKSTHHRMGGTK